VTNTSFPAVQVHEAEGYADPHYGHNTLNGLMGRTVSDGEIGSMVGAHPGDHVEIQGERGFSKDGGAVTLTLRSGEGQPFYHGTRVLEHDSQGKLVMQNQEFHVGQASRGQGIGTRVFANEVASLSRMGVDRIETIGAGYGPRSSYAARRGGKASTEAGYYTWARLGYNARIPNDVRSSLPDTLRGAQTLHDLMRTTEGRDFWRDYGHEVDLTFDLHAGSASMQALQTYTAARHPG
jgi:hypothetical protein